MRLLFYEIKKVFGDKKNLMFMMIIVLVTAFVNYTEVQIGGGDVLLNFLREYPGKICVLMGQIALISTVYTREEEHNVAGILRGSFRIRRINTIKYITSFALCVLWVSVLYGLNIISLILVRGVSGLLLQSIGIVYIHEIIRSTYISILFTLASKLSKNSVVSMSTCTIIGLIGIIISL